MTSSLAELLAVFDVEPRGERRFIGHSDAGERDVIDASQLLSQSIVAASKTLPSKTVRRASGIFVRPVRACDDIDFSVEVVQDGRSFATVTVTCSQGRTCASITMLMDTPGDDVIRHTYAPPTRGADEAIPFDMPLSGRELRLIDVVDPNDPDDVGPPVLDAWLCYAQTPRRTDLAKALLAHFTGHLAISTTMRAHPGVGTAMAHRSLSTAVLAIGISFHEPIGWEGWIRYSHESTFAGAGVSYVRGEIIDATGRPLASFTQDGLIREMPSAAGALAERSRL